MLHVLIVVSSDPQYDSRSTKYLNSLLEAGFKAKVVGISNDGTSEKSDTMVRIPLDANRGKKFFLQFYRRVIPEVRNSPAKFIIAGDLFSLPPAIINKRKYSQRENPVKLIYDSKELYEELPSLKVKRSSFIFWNLVEKNSIRFVDGIITVNKSIADILETKWHMHPAVIMNVPETINSTNEAAAKSFDKIFLTFSGGLQPGRGLHSLIKLLSALPEKYELRFVGDGDLRNELEHQAAALNLSKRTHFVGKVKNTEILRELSESHIGMCLIENAGQSYHLSLPNKFFQYITAGLPVIASDFPEMAAIVNKFQIGAAIDPVDLTNAAKKVLELTADKKVYLKLAANCREAAKVLNWQVEKEKFLSFIKSLM